MPDTEVFRRSIDSVDTAVRWWVAEGSGLVFGRPTPGDADNKAIRVYEGDSRGPRVKGDPDSGYATVVRVLDEPLGDVQERVIDDPDSTGTITLVRNLRIVRYSVQWYRDGAADLAHRFARWAVSSPGVEAAAKRGFTPEYPLKSLVQVNLPVSSKWERRWSLDLGVEYADDAAYRTGAIATAEIEVCGPDEGAREVVTVGS